MSETELDPFFKDLFKLITPFRIGSRYENIEAVLSHLNYTVERLMYEMMEPCDLLIEYCFWLGDEIPCNQIFKVATSAEGFCCSFNYHPLLDEKLV